MKKSNFQNANMTSRRSRNVWNPEVVHAGIIMQDGRIVDIGQSQLAIACRVMSLIAIERSIMSTMWKVLLLLACVSTLVALLNFDIGKGKPRRGSTKLGRIDSNHLEFTIDASLIADRAGFVISVLSSNLSEVIELSGSEIGQMILTSNNREMMIHIEIADDSTGTWISRDRPSVIMNAEASDNFEFINIDDIVQPNGCKVLIDLDNFERWPKDAEIWLSYMDFQ